MSAHDLDLTPRPSEPRRAHWTYERRASDPVATPARRSRRGTALAAVLGIGVGLGIVALWGTQIDGPEPMLSETAPIESRSPEYSTAHYEQVLSHRALMESRMTLGDTMTSETQALTHGSPDTSEGAIQPDDAVPVRGLDSETMSGSGADPSSSDAPVSGTSSQQSSGDTSVGPASGAASDSASEPVMGRDVPSATERGAESGALSNTTTSDNPY